MARQLHLGAFMRPVSIHTGAWRYPGAFPDANFNFAHLKRFVRTLEAAKFDAFFMADHLAPLNMPIEALKAIAATRRRVEVERELADIEGRNVRNPAIQGRITYLREEIGRARAEEEALYDDLRRKAKEAEQREGTAPGIGKNQITPDEQKRIDELRGVYDRERDAMKGTSAERQVRLAGLQAERAALEAGRGPQAAKQEGLIAEDRARLDLNTAIGDTARQLGTEALANLGVADAYLKSSAAGQVAAARRQAMLDSLQSGVDVESRTKEILQNQAAAQAATSAQSVAALSEEVAIREKVAAATYDGSAALARAEVVGRVELETLPEAGTTDDASACLASRPAEE